MKVTFFDKVNLIGKVYGALTLFPSIKKKVSLLFRPFDAPRYHEFGYLEKFLTQKKLKGMKVLDVSSPYIMAYLLSKHNNVIKTDIDSTEKRFIEENKNLFFALEDGTHLSFQDNTFDFVYSVSVIEHIYEKYNKAIEEMIRVVKSGGYVYVTFPVSKEYQEEWVEGSVYEKQHKENNKTFFQYRFDEKYVATILESIKKNEVVIIHQDIFWERKDGEYDKLVDLIKDNHKNIYSNFIKNVVVNIWYGFFLFRNNPAHDFSHATSCGNMHIVLQKTR
jgi:ubiquinone/menaquinone biosynthesis C-methylase UbiE